MSRPPRFTEHLDLAMPSLPSHHPIFRRTMGSNEQFAIPKAVSCSPPGNSSFAEADSSVCATPIGYTQTLADAPQPATGSSPVPPGRRMRSVSTPQKFPKGQKVAKALARGSELVGHLVKRKNGHVRRLGELPNTSQLTKEPESYVDEASTDRPQQGAVSLPDAGFRRGRTRSRVTAHLEAIRQGSEEPVRHRERRHTGSSYVGSTQLKSSGITAGASLAPPPPVFSKSFSDFRYGETRLVSFSSTTGPSFHTAYSSLSLRDLSKTKEQDASQREMHDFLWSTSEDNVAEDRIIVLPSLHHRIPRAQLPGVLDTNIPPCGDLPTSEWGSQEGVSHNPLSSSSTGRQFPELVYTPVPNPFSSQDGTANEVAVDFNGETNSKQAVSGAFPGDATDPEIVKRYRCPHDDCVYPLFHGHAFGNQHPFSILRYLGHL